MSNLEIRYAVEVDRFGPNTVDVVAFINSFSGVDWQTVSAARAAARDVWDADRAGAWAAARGAAWDAALTVAWDAAWDVAWAATWDAARAAAWAAARADAWAAARAAAWAVLVRDLISEEHYEILTAPMRDAGAKIPAWRTERLPDSEARTADAAGTQSPSP